MKETILLAPGAEGAELTGSLARHGVNCMNLRVLSAGELARMALLRSGISIAQEFVSVREENALIARAAKDVEYFRSVRKETAPAASAAETEADPGGDPECASDAQKQKNETGRGISYADVKQISAAVRRMRCLVTCGDEGQALEDILSLGSRGIFQEKNMALLKVYQNYMKLLQEKNAIDTVSLIRLAAKESQPLSQVEFAVLEEYPLNPLEEMLLKRVAGDEKPQRRSIRALFQTKGENPDAKIAFWNCYGAPNEVESILTDIYRNHPLDQCSVAVTDEAVYGQLFFDYAILYDIPMTFGCGIPVLNANPARLLVLYAKWLSGGFYVGEALTEMLSSPAFNRKALLDQLPAEEKDFPWDTFYEVLGNLRMTRDRLLNEQRLKAFRAALEEEDALPGISARAAESLRRRKLCLPALEIMARELALSPDAFIQKYARIRRGSQTCSAELLMMLDMAAARGICEELKVVQAARLEQSMEDTIRNVLQLQVCIQGSAPGKLHVTGVNKALCSLRENLYVAGLSAAEYPGSPRENYLLLDKDLMLFGNAAEPMTADGVIGRRKKQFLELVRLALELDVPVTMAYAGHNVSELKRDNASSLIFEIFQELSPVSVTAADLEAHTKEIGYFEPAVSRTRKVGEAYTQGKPLGMAQSGAKNDSLVPWNLERYYSPTALETFFNCARQFMLRYLMRIPEPETDDPFAVITALESGNLAHTLMERLANSHMSREDFHTLAGHAFDHFIAEHPPLIRDHVEAEKEQFLDMMDTAYEMDPQRKTLLKEEDIQAVHPSGVKIHGFPDRVEMLPDGTVQIVDFKTGQGVKHKQDDIETCLQVLLYAYLMEQKGSLTVSGGEYRYLRLGIAVPCRWDEAMKQRLDERLQVFRDSMLAGVFPPASDSSACKYCKFGSICGRNAGKEGENQ